VQFRELQGKKSEETNAVSKGQMPAEKIMELMQGHFFPDEEVDGEPSII